MKKGFLILLALLLLTGCGSGDSGTETEGSQEMGQYEEFAAVMSEAEAMVLFEEIYEINKYLEAGMTMKFDGTTVEIEGQTCICAVLGTEGEEGFTKEAHSAATWGCAYLLDPITGDWTAVAFG